LCAFDADGDLARPVWKRRVETEEVLPELRAFRQATGDQFFVRRAWLIDVFPEPEFPQHPGPEIVVWFICWYYSQSVIRIYDLRGELLYQAWHDGIAYSCYWMSDAGLLVFAGNCHWPHHDSYGNLLGERVYDFVLFALRPEPGFIADSYLDYLSSRPGDERLDPVWYLRLQLDNGPDVAKLITLQAPFPPNDPGRCVAFDVRLNHPMAGYVIAAIDELGEEVPASRIVADAYKRNQNLADDHPDKLDLPDPDEFKLANDPTISVTFNELNLRTFLYDPNNPNYPYTEVFVYDEDRNLTQDGPYVNAGRILRRLVGEKCSA